MSVVYVNVSFFYTYVRYVHNTVVYKKENVSVGHTPSDILRTTRKAHKVNYADVT